jgi:hypothetical protein
MKVDLFLYIRHMTQEFFILILDVKVVKKGPQLVWM